MEINGDVTMETTNDKQTISENRASQQIDQGLLTFATMYCFTSFTNIHGPKNICWAKIILYIVTLAADVLFQSNGGVITMAMDGLSFTFL